MKKNYQIVACLAFAFGFFVHSSQAQTNFYFDANGATAGIGGSGSWTTNGTSWTTNSAGTNAPISGNWVSGCPNTATLQGTSGTITLNSVNCNQLLVNSNDFVISVSAGSNRYIYATNTTAGVILADGVTLNLTTAAVAYNGGMLGISGNITNAPGTNGYSTIAITGNSGTTSGSGIRVSSRYGWVTNATNTYYTNGGTSGTNTWYVKVNVKTTGTGGAILGTADTGSVLNLRGTVTVDSGSLLALSPGSAGSRTINVYSNIITSATNAVQIGGDVTNNGTVVLRASNTITGELPVVNGSLWYAGSINACGDAKVVLKTGARFGQGGSISAVNGVTNEVLPNNIRIDGDPTFGGGGSSCYFGGNIDLNGGARTVTFANSTTLSGAMTNGSLNLTNSDSTRSMTFNGPVNLTNFMHLSAGTANLNGNSSINSLVVSNGLVVMGAGTNTIGTYTVNRGSLNAADLGIGSKTLTLAGTGGTAILSNTATTGALNVGVLNINGTLGGTNNIAMSTTGSMTVTSSNAVTLSGSNNLITLSGGIVSSGVTYTLLSGASINTNGLTQSLTLTGSGVNNATVVLDGPAVTSGRNIYTFRSTSTALELQVDVNPAMDLSWNGGETGDWNIDPTNTNWIMDGVSYAFLNGNNAIISSGGTLNVDAGGVTAGVVTVTGTNNTIIAGGSLTGVSLTKSGTGTLTLNGSETYSQGLFVDSSSLLIGNGAQITAPLSLTNADVSGGTITASSVNSTASVGVTNTISTVIAGNAGFTKNGLGTTLLSGSNTFNGAITISAGALVTSGADKLPDTTTVGMSSNTILRLGGNETLQAISAPSTSVNTAQVDLQGYQLTLTGTASNAFVGSIIGSGSVVKNGSGILTLTNTSTFSGGMQLYDGFIRLQGSGNRATNGAIVTLTSSPFGLGTLTLAGGSIYSTSVTTGRSIYNNVCITGDFTMGDLTYASGDMTVSTNVTGAFTVLSNNPTITTVANVDWEQPISGASKNLTKVGASTLTLWGTNNLNKISVNSGALIIRNSNNIPTIDVNAGALFGSRGNGGAIGQINVAGGGILNWRDTNAAFGTAVINLSNGAILGQTNSMGTTTADRLINNKLNLLGDVAIGMNAITGLGGYASYFSGNVDLGGATRTITAANSAYFYGAITNGGLSLTRANTDVTSAKAVTLYGANSYSGGTTLNGLIGSPDFLTNNLALQLGNDQSLGSGSLSLAGEGNLTVKAVSSSTDIYNASRSISNNISIGSGVSGVFDAGTNSVTSLDGVSTGIVTNHLTLSGAISGEGALVKTNNGDLTLTGALSYAGGTTVADGNLIVVKTALTTTISSNAVVVNFANDVPAGSTYQVLPGVLNGTNYSPATYTGLSATKKASFDSSTGVVAVALKTDPAVTWPTAASITYGQALSAATLSGGSSNGSFAFTSSGAIPEAGISQNFEVTFTPTDTSNYNILRQVVVVTVNKADVQVTSWPTASAITAGQPLSSSNLLGGSATGVGGANVAGAFAWTSGSPTPSVTGSYEVTFTPDSSNYKTATQSVSVAVNSAGPTFADAFGAGTETVVGADGLPNLLRYAMGATNVNAPVVKTVSSLDADNLSITAIVRTNDPKVTLVGEFANDLTAWNTNKIAGSRTADQTGATPGQTERQVFSTPRGGTKTFLRLKAVQQN